jgi:hypothetical protein
MTRSMLQLARDVAAALGDGWTSQPGHHDTHASIAHPDGRRLFLFTQCWGGLNGRLQITGCYPDPGAGTGWRFKHSDVKDRITVSPDRDPAVIARDIDCRLLPVYDPEFAYVSGRVAEAQAEAVGAGRRSPRASSTWSPGRPAPTARPGKATRSTSGSLGMAWPSRSGKTTPRSP